jgi:hypothetical protein
MKKFTLILLTFITLISVELSASQKKKVLFIGIDGCRSDALQMANVPNIDSFIAHGFFTWDSWHLGTTVSGPSWSSMLCGVFESKHGVTDNSFSGSKYNAYPPFTKRAKEKLPKLKAIEVNDWQPLVTQMYNSGFDQKIYVGVDGNMSLNAKECIKQLRDTGLDVLFAYYGQPDWVGHAQGFSPKVPAYMNIIHVTDSCIGVMMDSLRARPNYKNEDWLVLLCTDHGGVNYGHGGNSDNERHIWWMASNDKIKNNTQITCKDPGSFKLAKGVDTALLAKCPVQVDIAVTALDWLLSDINVDYRTQGWKLDGKSWLKYIVPTITSLKEEVKYDFAVKVAPNPSNQIFTAWFENKNIGGLNNKAQVFDMSGKLILTQPIIMANKVNIDMDGQKSGNYILKLTIGNQSVNKQIIKN